MTFSPHEQLSLLLAWINPLAEFGWTVRRLYLPRWQLGVTPKPLWLSHPTARALKYIYMTGHILDGSKPIQTLTNSY